MRNTWYVEVVRREKEEELIVLVGLDPLVRLVNPLIGQVFDQPSEKGIALSFGHDRSLGMAGLEIEDQRGRIVVQTPIRILESKCIVSSLLIVCAVERMPNARLTLSCRFS